MKKLLILTVILAFVAMSASAQVPKPFSFYFGAGMSPQSSPDGFKDYYNQGFHGMGAFGYNMNPGFQVMGKLEYHSFGFDTDAEASLATSFLSLLGNQQFVMMGGAGKYSFGLPAAPVKPYVIGGVGLAAISYEISSASVSELYYEFGGGAEFKIGPAMNLFAMARFVNIAVEGGSYAYIPVSVGLKF